MYDIVPSAQHNSANSDSVLSFFDEICCHLKLSFMTCWQNLPWWDPERDYNQIRSIQEAQWVSKGADVSTTVVSQPFVSCVRVRCFC